MNGFHDTAHIGINLAIPYPDRVVTFSFQHGIANLIALPMPRFGMLSAIQLDNHLRAVVDKIERIFLKG